jgi:hypothetical protein
LTLATALRHPGHLLHLQEDLWRPRVSQSVGQTDSCTVQLSFIRMKCMPLWSSYCYVSLFGSWVVLKEINQKSILLKGS